MDKKREADCACSFPILLFVTSVETLLRYSRNRNLIYLKEKSYGFVPIAYDTHSILISPFLSNTVTSTVSVSTSV